MILPGLVDIHCHILPGIDDGARDLEQSVAMARLWAAAGFAAVVATPHYIPGTAWAAEAQTVAVRVAALQARLDAEAIPLRVYPGMEIAFHKRLAERQHRAGLQPVRQPLMEGDLHARVHAQGDPFGVEPGLYGREPRGDDTAIRGPGRARDEMGRGHHRREPGRHVQPRHGRALVQVAGAVVDAGQDVAVDVDQAVRGHAVVSASARAVLPTSLVSRAVASSAARVTA